MATVNASGDVLVQVGPLTLKVRSEEIVIRNQDPSAKRVDIYESARLVSGEAMGAPMVTSLRSVPVDAELLSTVLTIDGVEISALQVLKWFALWAARINAEDADAMVQRVSGFAP